MGNHQQRHAHPGRHSKKRAEQPARHEQFRLRPRQKNKNREQGHQHPRRRAVAVFNGLGHAHRREPPHQRHNRNDDETQQKPGNRQNPQPGGAVHINLRHAKTDPAEHEPSGGDRNAQPQSRHFALGHPEFEQPFF
jgi:hypothetical protein